jgi:hypothetical protein
MLRSSETRRFFFDIMASDVSKQYTSIRSSFVFKDQAVKEESASPSLLLNV